MAKEKEEFIPANTHFQVLSTALNAGISKSIKLKEIIKKNILKAITSDGSSQIEEIEEITIRANEKRNTFKYKNKRRKNYPIYKKSIQRFNLQH